MTDVAARYWRPWDNGISLTARDEAHADSDIDLFFDHPEGSLKTDIMTRRSLHRVLRESIEASALQVF